MAVIPLPQSTYRRRIALGLCPGPGCLTPHTGQDGYRLCPTCREAERRRPWRTREAARKAAAKERAC